MHIPDGYLSPSTCAAAYAVAAPFWVAAFRRVQGLLHTRVVPLLAVMSAFCFVIMMFNLPLPGGTTGHAVGVGIATVVLGPWASMVAISMALLIQALFFGDGGITALGANCLNMAVVGSLVAHLVYRAIAANAAMTAPRRVVAAGLAGYVAINASALLAALEFGLQPLLFHDAGGTPLYAPYPWSVAIPAMMIGHLTWAGLAELTISAGLVAYLQRSHPDLMRLSPLRAHAAPAGFDGWRLSRRLWAGVAVLMLLSPLGLLAAGVAWGEWSVADLQDPAMRQDILQASSQVAPPEAVPAGLARLTQLWNAPIPDYLPSFLPNPSLGYLLSAVSGGGAIALLFLGLSWLLSRRTAAAPERD